MFNLAADMGGMGFIQSNHSVIMYNNTMIRWAHARGTPAQVHPCAAVHQWAMQCVSPLLLHLLVTPARLLHPADA